jgi:hypothetical protein
MGGQTPGQNRLLTLEIDLDQGRDSHSTHLSRSIPGLSRLLLPATQKTDNTHRALLGIFLAPYKSKVTPVRQ